MYSSQTGEPPALAQLQVGWEGDTGMTSGGGNNRRLSHELLLNEAFPGLILQIKFCFSIHVSGSGFVHMNAGAGRGQKRAAKPPQLELQVVVVSLMASGNRTLVL